MKRCPPQPDTRDFGPVRRELGPFQFSLRGLFMVMTCLAVLFALMGWVGAVGSVALVFLLVLVAAHVAGNAIGTHLRDQTTQTLTSQRRDNQP